MGGSLSHPDRDSSVVTKKVLQELIPRFELPLSLGSVNGLTFDQFPQI